MAEMKWEPFPQLTEEDVAKMLEERPGGRNAGGENSPYMQEYYEELYGIMKKKKREKKEDDEE